MCLIIHKPKAELEIPDEVIDHAVFTNSDGFGIVYLDNGEMITDVNSEAAYSYVFEERPFVAHLRFATRGKVTQENCHPFPIQKEGTKAGFTGWLFSNGTVDGLGSRSGACDTEEVAKLLAQTPQKYWQHVCAMTPTRFATVNDKGLVRRFGRWHEHDGIFYSNDNCGPWGYSSRRPMRGSPRGGTTYSGSMINRNYVTGDDITQEDLVLPKNGSLLAVYGTLKSGFNNHYILGEGDAEFVGHAESVDNLCMTGEGVPFLSSEPNDRFGHNVTLEIYRVNSATTWRRLDQLEGHPTFYRRGPIKIKMESGETKEVITYFNESYVRRGGATYKTFPPVRSRQQAVDKWIKDNR